MPPAACRRVPPRSSRCRCEPSRPSAANTAWAAGRGAWRAAPARKRFWILRARPDRPRSCPAATSETAERGGFEPPKPGLAQFNGLANRRLRPLGHLSRLVGFQFAEEEGFEPPSPFGKAVFKTAAF